MQFTAAELFIVSLALFLMLEDEPSGTVTHAELSDLYQKVLDEINKNP